MYPPERRQAITRYLFECTDHHAGVVQIGRRLGVTYETVRKDLEVLERRGVVRRVRGGAELLVTIPFEQALAARHAEQFPDKMSIAGRVVTELPDDGVVILDSGSLTFVCAQLMPTDRSLTLVTNNLPAARHLAGRTQMQIMTLPGSVRGLTSAAVDPWTTRRLGTISADLAIVGVNGLSAERGLMTTNPEESAVKRAMLLAARRRVVPVISGRLGRSSFCTFAAASEVDLVITDRGAPPEIVASLTAAGPGVVVV
ncbi:MAG: DeoR/GlpR family DNA-binding transcription regulator [Microlunatus sp.]|nr:DeoR/GlpR family DNA-binding transcription regulator [Microlunatus sp.]MDN5770328.1 DeoR/GlpR family DNA-binding transcription regulator [Microlunatus sp.]